MVALGYFVINCAGQEGLTRTGSAPARLAQKMEADNKQAAPAPATEQEKIIDFYLQIW